MRFRALLNNDPELADSWDRFVLEHPQGRFCHLMGYKKVVEDTYGYRAIYSALEDGKRILGVFPSFLCKSLFFGRKIVSQPFSEYGGILAQELTENDYQQVFEELREVMHRRRISLVEMHGALSIPEAVKERYLHPVVSHQRAVLRLDGKVDEMWKKRINYEVRKAVRKAERSKVTCYERVDRNMIANEFYPLFLASMKRLGVPPHSVAYYLECHEHLKDNLRIFWAEYEGRIIAALLGFAVGRAVHIINTVSDDKHWEKRPNDLCHWHFIKWAAENGYECFDMGSVRYEGQRRYKQKWGAELEEYLHYAFAPGLTKNKMNSKTFDSSSRTMEFFGSVWQKFMPMQLSRFVGPIIRRELAR